MKVTIIDEKKIINLNEETKEVRVFNDSPKVIINDIGERGLAGKNGEKGESLEFEDLTELQKEALRGDVGNTSTNYTNIFIGALQ